MTAEQFAQILSDAMKANGFDSISAADLKAVAESNNKKSTLTDDQWALEQTLRDVQSKLPRK